MAPFASNEDRGGELVLAVGQAIRDGEGGKAGILERIVVTPTLSRLTHLVIRPEGFIGAASRLVPVDAIHVLNGEVTLPTEPRWPDQYDYAEITELLPMDDRLDGGDLPWPSRTTMVWPYLDLPGGPQAVVMEHLPAGQVAIGVGGEVRALDGPVGRIAAFVTNPSEQGVTHIVLRHGHLWGDDTVLVPIRHVRAVSGGDVELDIGADGLRQHSLP